MFTKLIVGFSFALAMLAPFNVVQAGIDVPGWYDDVSDARACLRSSMWSPLARSKRISPIWTVMGTSMW